MKKNNDRENIALRNIDLIAYDFDGVFTDNKVIVSEDGKEAIIANRSDGLAVSMLKKRGIQQIIITMETNKVVTVRAKKLGIPVIQGVDDKKDCLLKYCAQNNYDMRKVVYIGNDINDLEVMKVVGYPVAPLNAEEEIKSIARFIINKNGGEGVVRSFLKYIEF